MFAPALLTTWLAALIFLAAGLFFYRADFRAARGLQKFAAIGPVFFATGVGIFGVVHYVRTAAVTQIVPAWMPARVFWTYFCGAALLAAAASILTKKFVSLSSPLLAAMFLIFVLAIHLPNALQMPESRLFWAIFLRDLSFSAGAWAISREKSAATAARFVIAIAAAIFGIEQLLHPQFIPGVPLNRLTPDFIPLASNWGYPVGAVLLFTGAAMLTSKHPRGAVAFAGLLVTLVTIFIELPGFLKAAPPDLAAAFNGVGDTLLYAGALLCAARALPE